MLPPRRLALLIAGAADASVRDVRRWLDGGDLPPDLAALFTHTAARLELTTDDLGPKVKLYAAPPSASPPSTPPPRAA